MKIKKGGFLIIAITAFLLAVSAHPAYAITTPEGYTVLGKGNTCAYYIDNDADGYGVGKRSSGDYSDIYARGDMPDADDNDASVHTGAEAIQKWGSMRNFLVHLGYNPNHIYYVSQAGNDTTGVPNDSNHPYAVPQFGCADWQSTGVAKLLEKGDVVIYREGEYDSIWVKIIQGDSANPIVFMAYPGEQVLLTYKYGGVGIGSGSCNKPGEYLVFDGFINGPEAYDPTCKAAVGSGCVGCADHITIRNMEIRNCFWGISWSNPYFTLENSLFHGNHEHSLYISSFDAYPETEGVVVRNNIFGAHTAVSGYGNVHNNGHARGSIYEGNIIHSSCGTGLDFQSGAGKDAIIKNNLIFNNGKTAIQISNSGGGMLYNQENMTIANNTLYAPQRSYCDSCNYPQYANDYSSISLSSETDSAGTDFSVRDIKITNNILILGRGDAIKITGHNHNETLNTITAKNNIIYHRDPGSQGTIIIECSEWYCGDSTVGKYTLTQLESGFANFSGNLVADPLFTDVSTDYYANPERMNFDLTLTSPAIDLGISTYAPTTDLRGNQRSGLPDAGCYEYASGAPPVIAYGDVSGNGEISAADASLAAQYAVGLISLTPEQITKADVSGNGEVSAADASLIAQRAVGLIDKFPVEGQ